MKAIVYNKYCPLEVLQLTSGEIAALGKGVTHLNVGDAVYAFTGMKFKETE